MRIIFFIFTLALISFAMGCVTSEKKEVTDVCPHGTSLVVKPPPVDQKKIKEGWLFGRYPKADSGPYFKGNLDAVIEKAQKDKKWVVVSIGRDACPLTTRFYHYVESGLVPLDMDKYVYVKLDIDDYEQQDAFCQHFMVEGNLLPFIGVITKDGRATDLHYGYGTSDDFAAFIKEKSE
ncbi:MAG: hypothetical protein WCJ02_01475 [bacterium]